MNQTSKEEVPVILVGGGSVLIDSSRPLKGTSGLIKPPNHSVANAVGAALSQVSGLVDYTEDLSKISRQQAIHNARQRATEEAIKAGADPNTVQVPVV